MPPFKNTGIEKHSQAWGVNVGADVVQDPKNTTSGTRVIVTISASIRLSIR